MENIITDLPIILIAEDHLSNYLLFEFLLKKSYRLIHATNGIEAIKLFKSGSPQLILMDIKMPQMDGFEATVEIRKYSQKIPIIATTAYAFDSEKDKILNSGFSDYLSKPITAKELKGKIAEFLK